MSIHQYTHRKGHHLQHQGIIKVNISKSKTYYCIIISQILMGAKQSLEIRETAYINLQSTTLILAFNIATAYNSSF